MQLVTQIRTQPIDLARKPIQDIIVNRKLQISEPKALCISNLTAHVGGPVFKW